MGRAAGRGSRAVASAIDPFAATLGSRRGALSTAAPTGPALSTVHPELDFATLAGATCARHRDLTRQYLLWMGVRSSLAEHLWYRPQERMGDGGDHRFIVHLRAHSLSDSTLCPEQNEYGEWTGKAEGMRRCPRGAWADPEHAQQVDGANWVPCRRCAAAKELKEDTPWRNSLSQEMVEAADYPALPPERAAAFTARVEEAIAHVPAPGRSFGPERLQELCDAAYWESLVDEAVAFAGAQHDDAYKRLLPNYRSLWERLPRDNRGLPMRLSKFLGPDDLREAYSQALESVLASGDETSWGDVRRAAAESLSKRVRRLLALRELALTAD